MFRTAFWLILIPVVVASLLGATPTARAQDAWTPPGWVMNPEAAAEYNKREKRNAREAQRSPRPSKSEIDVLKKLVYYYASQLTFPERDNLPKDVRDRFLTELLSGLTSSAAREEMIKIVMGIVPDLLTHPDLVVRENAVLMLVDCSIEPAQLIPATPPKPYDQSHQLLIQIASDSSQDWVVRNAAVLGLQRIARDGKLGNPERSNVAAALIKGMTDAAGEKWWFRFRLVEALGDVDRITLVDGTPAIIETLMDRLADEKEHFLVRSEAARSISRLPLTGANIALIMEQVGRLLEQMSRAQAKVPQAPVWRQCYGRIYLSFRPSNEAQARRGWGFLYKPGNAKTTAEGLWAVAFPVLKPFVEQAQPPAVPAGQADTIKMWVETTKEATPDRRVVPNGTKTY